MRQGARCLLIAPDFAAASGGATRPPLSYDNEMRTRVFVCLLFFCLAQLSSADVIDDVRNFYGQNNSAAADAELRAYRAQKGVTPEYLEALSWAGRGSLASRDLDHAAS